MADPDWSDPCAVLTWLRPKFYQLVAGGGAVRVRYGENEVVYAQQQTAQLETLIRRLERDCAVKSGTSKRRAFRAG